MSANTLNLTTWSVWWEFNKDPFLRLKESLGSIAPVTGSDQYYLGNSKRYFDTVAPSEQDKTERILPALAGALARTRNRDITTAILVAMAKMGRETDEIELIPLFKQHLSRGDQEVRETATLAMGIAGLVEAEDSLTALLGDTAAGRQLVAKPEVSDRTRAFAAYALGILASQSVDADLKDRVYRQLLAGLKQRTLRSRDLAVALIEALGLLAPDEQRGARDKRLLWQVADQLWEYYGEDRGQGWQLIQSHVPIALARLLGRGDGVLHERIKDGLAAELTQRSNRQNAIYQSAALALGAMALPPEESVSDKAYTDALLHYYRKGSDRQAKWFCLVALGQIGGARNRDELIRFHVDGQAGTVKPWTAMALGVLGFTNRNRGVDGAVDATLGQILHRDFREVENPEARAALAVALGLCGYRAAAVDLVDHLEQDQLDDVLAGYVCIGLALMEDRRSVEQIRSVAARSARRPQLLQQAAVALGKLGDQQAVPFLQDMLTNRDQNLARLSAAAVGLGFIGDRRSVAPLVDQMSNDRLTKLAQAFVAAALGGIADKDLLPWNTVLAVNMNYRARVDTLTNGRSGVLDIL